MKTTLSIIMGAALCAAIVLGSSSQLARAGDEFDCSKAEKWVKRTSSYDKGKVVSYKVRSSDFHYHAFRCDSGYCTSEPSKSRDWADLGECKYGSDPH
jgi:hypothetical protein